MTCAAPIRPSSASKVDRAQDQHGVSALGISFQKFDPGKGAHLTEFDARSRQVIEALWLAFPEATSEHDLSERAAPYFRDCKTGEAINSKTIRLWLRGVSLPRTEHTLVLIGMVGADFFNLPRRGRRE